MIGECGNFPPPHSPSPQPHIIRSNIRAAWKCHLTRDPRVASNPSRISWQSWNKEILQTNEQNDEKVYKRTSTKSSLMRLSSKKLSFSALMRRTATSSSAPSLVRGRSSICSVGCSRFKKLTYMYK